MRRYRNGLVLIAMIGLTHIGYTQTVYKIQDNKDVDIKLLGTSTFHDWEMDAKKGTGEAQFVFKSVNESELTSLKSLTFTLEVKDLKSDNKGLDKNAYKALKTDEYKNIHYKLTSSAQSPEKGGYLLKTKGKLTVAGVTNDIVMDIHIVMNETGAITCKGAYKLNMTDYDVEPPSFMMGVMKTGDTATLDFEVKYII